MTADECLEHQWLSTKREPLNQIQLPTEKLKRFLIRRKWQVSHSQFDQFDIIFCTANCVLFSVSLSLIFF